MSKPNALPGEVIDVQPLGPKLSQTKHSSVLEAEQFKIKRMVLTAGKELPEHAAPADIIVHCLEGRFEFTERGRTHELIPGQLIHLQAGELHSVKAIEDSSFLLTILTAIKT